MSIFELMKESDDFSSIYEYKNLLLAIEDAKHHNLIEQIPVGAKRYVAQVESWYREMSSGSVYSLIPPEFPAKGYWGPVPLEEFQFSQQPE